MVIIPFDSLLHNLWLLPWEDGISADVECLEEQKKEVDDQSQQYGWMLRSETESAILLKRSSHDTRELRRFDEL